MEVVKNYENAPKGPIKCSSFSGSVKKRLRKIHSAISTLSFELAQGRDPISSSSLEMLYFNKKGMRNLFLHKVWNGFDSRNVVSQ
ncbi:hypothetical protein VNO77_19767 [Canavalia gladiata]|uniref:Uncharacterized protein n=1 Tax=Canavalia gladiata TaxID=3824 RepID=A0AAN9QKT6_CANGL